ncbi:MAG: sigma-54-dependent Fis family transcriptional regulator [Aquificae bacterium]|nr:sigma-54-dependent Fis family transcriptional regulator [Aquificota bacterium]
MKILLIDDDKDFLQLTAIKLNKEGFNVDKAENLEEAKSLLQKNSYELILLDQYMPDREGIDAINEIKEIKKEIPIVIMTAYGNVQDAVEAIKKGAFYYILKPIDIEELRLIIDKIHHITNLKKEISTLKEIIETDFIAESPIMKTILKNAEKIAPFDITVLITGESGTGKEMLAKYIHKKSKRKNKPFIAVNCGAIPRDLLESELFGYEKGAFTGATHAKKGLIEEANGGTLFLDEIGELPLDLQVKLLRVLEEGEIRPLGSTKSKKIDVRFIAATNRDLDKMVKEGRFREDLYYRLNVVRLHIPPLRERKEDILPLARFFIKKYSLKYGIPEKKLSKKAQNQLLEYGWEGNVRELQHLIEKTLILNENETINQFNISQSSNLIRPYKEEKERFEKNYIKKLLDFTNWNISKASKLSGKTRAEIYRKIKKYNLTKDVST